MEIEFIQEAAEMLKVMGNPERIRIAQLLERGERRVGDLADELGLSQSTCSQHLRAMRLRGLLTQRREGNVVYYAIARPEIYKILQCIRDTREAALNGRGETSVR